MKPGTYLPMYSRYLLYRLTLTGGITWGGDLSRPANTVRSKCLGSLNPHSGVEDASKLG